MKNKPREFWIEKDRYGDFTILRSDEPFHLPHSEFLKAIDSEYAEKIIHDNDVENEVLYNELCKDNDNLKKQLEAAKAELKEWGSSDYSKAFEIQNLKQQLAAAKAEVEKLKDPEYHKLVLEAVKALRYIKGIVERGESREVPGNEQIEMAILNYVKSLESQLAVEKAKSAKLVEALKSLDTVEYDYGIRRFCRDTVAEYEEGE
jgi:hypothetical protein